MKFTGDITPGDVLIAISIVVSVFGAYASLKSDVRDLHTKIDAKLETVRQEFAPVYKWWDRKINNGGNEAK